MHWPNTFADPKNQLAVWRLWGAAAETLFYSTVTVNARLQQIGSAMVTGGAMPSAEIMRMTHEKPVAATDSFLAAWRANVMLASDPTSILRAATAGLGPYTRKTRSNARRLRK
jgi:fructose-1-phosphate kinase PfkB-like protein